MPPDLKPVIAVADMIGVMDRPRRQEAQPLVQDVEGIEIRSEGFKHGQYLARVGNDATAGVAAARRGGFVRFGPKHKFKMIFTRHSMGSGQPKWLSPLARPS